MVKKYFVWKGYIIHPVDDLKWKATQEAKPWNGRLKLLNLGKRVFKRICFENSESQWSGSEDCLYLNIWTPKLSRVRLNGSDQLPVMMWIHGGLM